MCRGDAEPHPHCDCYRRTYSDRYCHRDGCSYSDRDSYCYGSAYRHGNRDSYSSEFADSDCDRYLYRDCHCYCYCHRNGDPNRKPLLYGDGAA